MFIGAVGGQQRPTVIIQMIRQGLTRREAAIVQQTRLGQPPTPSRRLSSNNRRMREALGYLA